MLKMIDNHQEKYGRDEHLIFSILGGDLLGGFPPQGIWVDDNKDNDDEENFFDDADLSSVYSEIMEPYHDVQQQVQDAFGEGDQLCEQTIEVEVYDDVDGVEADELSARLDLLDEMSR